MKWAAENIPDQARAGHASTQSLATLQRVMGTLNVVVLVAQFAEQYAMH